MDKEDFKKIKELLGLNKTVVENRCKNYLNELYEKYKSEFEPEEWPQDNDIVHYRGCLGAIVTVEYKELQDPDAPLFICAERAKYNYKYEKARRMVTFEIQKELVRQGRPDWELEMDNLNLYKYEFCYDWDINKHYIREWISTSNKSELEQMPTREFAEKVLENIMADEKKKEIMMDYK